MEDKIWTKQVLAGNGLSAISELQEHKFTERQANTEVSKTHHSSKAMAMLPGKQRQSSQMQSNTTGKFPAVLPATSSECSADSPLKGTPWGDAAISSVIRKKRSKRSVKEEEHIEFWQNFFG